MDKQARIFKEKRPRYHNNKWNLYGIRVIIWKIIETADALLNELNKNQEP